MLVVGDLILDTYVFGQVERISPEAPVPVISAERSEDRLGGASAVAHMLARLGAQVRLAGMVGEDAAATSVRRLLTDAGINTMLVGCDPTRATTVKTALHR